MATSTSIVGGVGIGTGMKITELVNAIILGETGAKQNQIARQTSNTAAMISGVGALRSALTTFTDAMAKLNDKTAPSFNAYAATSANEGVVKVSSGNTAVAGNYDISVSKLATGSKVASQSFAGPSSAITAGNMTIGQGTNSYNVKIESGATLQSVRDQINKDLSGKGISANIVSDSNGSRLVLSSTTTGAGSDISVTGIPELEIDGTQSMKTSGSGAGYITDVAQDAELTIDGLAVKSASNTVKDAISGISLELTGTTPTGGSSTKITVAANNDGLKTSVQAFVDAYNKLQSTVTALTSTTRDAEDNVVLGPLSNDPTTRSMLGDIRKVLAEVGSGDRLTSLSQLGINTMKDGKLEFNATKFGVAMNDKQLGEEVQELFSGDNGVFERMKKAIDPYNATDGSLASRKAGLDRVAKNLDDQQSALTRRIDTMTVSLTTKYAKLDAALAAMQKQAEQLNSFFEAMNARAKNS